MNKNKTLTRLLRWLCKCFICFG